MVATLAFRRDDGHSALNLDMWAISGDFCRPPRPGYRKRSAQVERSASVDFDKQSACLPWSRRIARSVFTCRKLASYRVPMESSIQPLVNTTLMLPTRLLFQVRALRPVFQLLGC